MKKICQNIDFPTEAVLAADHLQARQVVAEEIGS